MIPYRCIDLLESPLLKDAVVVAGDDHLINNIRWAHAAELSEHIEKVSFNVMQNDLLLITGPILQTDPNGPELALEVLTRLSIDKGLAGIVLFQREYMKEVPTRVIRQAKKAHLPLIFVREPLPPTTDLVAEITYGIMNHDSNRVREENLLNDIIANDIRDEASFLARADYHRYDLRVPHQAMFLYCTKPKKRTNKSEKDAFVKSSGDPLMYRITKQVMERYYNRVLLVAEQDFCICLLPENMYMYSANRIAEQLLNDIHVTDPTLDVYIGIGNRYGNLSGFHQSILEAKQIVDAMQLLKISNAYRTLDRILVPVFLMDHMNDPTINMIYEQSLLRLARSDSSLESDLIHTLEVYFECDKNISTTAETLYIHRNTLRNRLQRIEQLLQKDLSNADDCFELMLALYIHKLK